MATIKKKRDETPPNLKESRRLRPAKTLEGRENQLISLAVDLAEKQLREGTASAQVITHYLKLGSTKERLEMEKLKKENDLLIVKKQAIESSKRMEELYEEALSAFRDYNGQHHDEE